MKILKFTAFLCAMLICTGCSSGGSSADDEVPAPSIVMPEDFPEEETTEKPTLSNQSQTFSSDDGMFKFAIDSVLERSNDKKFSDYEFHFRIKEEDLHLCVMTVSGSHQTAKGFSDHLIKEISDDYLNLTGQDGEINGMPAYKAHADCPSYGENYKFGYAAVQYGNGDLFIVIGISPDSSAEYCSILADDLLNSVIYKGKDVRTKDATVDNAYFKATVSPDFYVESSDDRSMQAVINLQESLDEAFCSMRLEAHPGSSSASVISSDTDEEDVYAGQEEILGCTAQKYTCKLELLDQDIQIDTFYLDHNGTCYSVSFISTEEHSAIFRMKMQPLLDNITLK